MILWGYMKLKKVLYSSSVFPTIATVSVMSFAVVFIAVFALGFLIPQTTEAAISRTLVIGSQGPDVRELQVILNKDALTQVAQTGVGSPGLETDYFGNLTKQAVIRYQEKYRAEILTPVGLYYGSGIVGPQTIKHVYAKNTGVSQSLTTSTPTNPTNTTTVVPVINQSTIATITRLSPSTGSNGDVITITGSGFSDTNTVLIDLDYKSKYTNIKSSESGTKIVFTLDTEAGRAIDKTKKELTKKQLDIWKSQFPPFPMAVRVETKYGISNPVNFNYVIE